MPTSQNPHLTQEDCADVLRSTYHLHKNSLPPQLAMTEEMAVGAAIMLAEGACGIVVWLLGREFCQELIQPLERLEAFELCSTLRLAIESGQFLFDDSGTIDTLDPALNLER